MYKRRQVAMPSLPSSPQSSDQAVSGSRSAQLGDSVFYHGQLGDSNNDTALLFASNGQLDLLHPVHLIYVDSTFGNVPSLYYQLFTIFVPYADYSFPIAYALMTRKTTKLYRSVLKRVHDLVPEFQRRQVIADFEEAPSAAMHDVFGPDVTISDCWFHFAQALLKKLKKKGISDACTNDEDTATSFFAVSWHCLFYLYLTTCLLYTSPSPRDRQKSRMPSSA